MIRDVRRSDAPALFTFLSEYFPEEQAIMGFRPDGFLKVVARVFRWDFRLILGLMALFGRRVFRFLVVEEDGKVVATTLVTLPPRAGYVSSVAVDPAYRRRGLARAMLEEARGTAQRAGRKYIALDVLDKNAPARALYDRIGYRPLRENRIMVYTAGTPRPSTPPTGLRAFNKKDAGPLTEIARQASSPEVEEVLPVTEAYFRTGGAIDRALASETAAWVIDRGRGPEAFVQATRSPATDAANLSAPVVAASVAPADAAALVATALAWCEARGAQRTMAQVAVLNGRGKAALEAGGFRDAISVWTLYRTVA
ncbi:MAG TPA: GNAT family N-acetyltransferase [Thermoplasmata archaeon]|nr:GNAT family N-acetyltransferase [Thermoplasmata archaeon]